MILNDEQRAQIHPSRALPASPIKLDAKKAWAALKKEWQRPKWEKLIGTTSGLLRDRLQALRGRATGEPPVQEEEDGLLFLILLHPEDDDLNRLRPLVDFHVASKGVLFSLKALLCLQSYHWEESGDSYELLDGPGMLPSYSLKEGWLHAWHRLRTHLSLASDADYQAARDWADQGWDAASPETQAAFAYLFPDADYAGRIVEQTEFGCVCLSLHRPEPLDRLVRRLDIEKFMFYVDSWDSQIAATRLTLLANVGDSCLPTLQYLFEKDEEDLGEVLALIPSVDALATLCANLDRDGVRENLQTATRQHPAIALAAIAQIAASRSKSAQIAQTLLAQMIRANDGSLEQQFPALPEASRKLVTAIWTKQRPASEAPLESLPSLLVHPPWLQKQTGKKAAAKATVTLSPFVVTPSERWAEGQREEWLSKKEEWRGEVEFTSDQEISEMVLDDLGLDHKYLRLLTEDVAELRDALQKDLEEEGWAWFRQFLFAPEALSLPIWNLAPSGTWYLEASDLLPLVAQFGSRGLPGLQRMAAEKPALSLTFMLPFGMAEQAPVAAAALGRKKDKVAAEKWLKTWPEVAAIALIPQALGKAGKGRDQAEMALRWLGRHGQTETVFSVAERYGQKAAVEGILDFDPMLAYPAKAPKMPDFWDPAGFSRPRLLNGQALPLKVVEHLGQMLAFTSLELPYVGIGMVKELCTPESLEEFSWDLFSAWSFEDFPSAAAWTMRALGLLGGDATARKLTPLLKQWPTQNGINRSIAGLDVLEAIGSDVALMHLNGMTQKIRYQKLQEAARQKVEAIAESRGLSAEELADRLVPDLGLDEQGSLHLDFGPRQFTVIFDELLRPSIRGADGNLLKTFPKANKSDDAEKAKEATETYKALQKDVKTLAGQQISRLETAMCSGRRWTAEVFRLFLAGHPLLGHLVRRLWWGAWSGDRLEGIFRVAEDGSFADREDNGWELPEQSTVGILHPIHLSNAELQQIGQVLSDYGVIQPFRQIGREVYLLTEEEKSSTTLERFVGKTTLAVRLLGLEHRGWRRALAEEGGMSMACIRPISATQFVRLEIDPGIIMGMIEEYPNQTLGKLTITRKNGWASDGTLFGAVDPLIISEVIREIQSGLG